MKQKFYNVKNININCSNIYKPIKVQRDQLACIHVKINLHGSQQNLVHRTSLERIKMLSRRP